MKKLLSLWITVVIILFQVHVSEACTGITLTTKDNSMILARTIEWGGSDLNSQYVVVPRGYEQYSYIPGGERSNSGSPQNCGGCRPSSSNSPS